jgi:hypothetical protein
MRLHYDDLRPTAFKSSSHKDAFGEFQSRYLCIQLNYRRGEGFNPLRVQSFLNSTDDPKQRVFTALQGFAYFHELRHFHDYFGTMAGINLFTNLIMMLREFVDMMQRLKDDRTDCILPLSHWAQQNSSPDFVRLFVNKYTVMGTVEQLVLGSMPLFTEKGFTDEAWREIEVPELNLTFPAFPLSAGVTSEDGSTEKVSIWRPIGLEALIEGNAQALQRSYLETFWPAAVVNDAWDLMAKADASVDRDGEQLDEALSRATLPYNLTDLLITRYLRKRSQHSPWERDALLRLTDSALMQSRIQCSAADITPPRSERKATNIQVTVGHPGQYFVGGVGEAAWNESTPASSFSLSPDSLRKMSDLFRDIKPPTRLRGGSAFDAIDIIESYVRIHIIARLLDLRVKYGNEIFSDAGAYFARSKDFPRPIMTVYTDDFDTPDEVDDFILEKWIAFSMLVNLVDQLLYGGQVISCPRAYPLIPGLGFFQLVQPDCESFIRSRSCLAWSKGALDSLPSCGFRNLIARLGLS